MSRKRTSLGIGIILLATSLPRTLAQDSPQWMRGRALNTVLSIEKIPEMTKFYGEVLGLEQMRTIDLPARTGRAATIMLQFRIGRSIVKMIPSTGNSGLPGGRAVANGLRVLSLPVARGDEIARRIESSGGKGLSWHEADGYRVAWVRDPDDNEVELRWYPDGAEESDSRRMELALTVADLEASRRHYGQWLGLLELPPLELPGFKGETYRYRVGDSILRLWSSGKDLPTDTGFTTAGYGIRYVQFIVRDADALHGRLVRLGAAIAQEPTPLGASVLLLFAADPDGVINECVGPGRPSPNTAR